MHASIRLLTPKPRLVFLATLLLTAAIPVAAQTTDELLTALQKGFPTKDGAPDPRFTQYLSAIKASVTQGRLVEAEQLVGNIRNSLSTPTEATTTAIEALLAAIRTQIAANAAKRDAALDTLVADTAAKFAARAPAAEFDTLLQRLAVLGAPNAGRYDDPTTQKVELVRNFITRSQDFVLQSAAGATEQAGSALSELIQLSSRLPAIPRSQLVALQTEMAKRPVDATDAATVRLNALRKTIESTIDSAKSASDFDAVLTELTKPTPDSGRSYGNPNSVASQTELLRRFVHRWQDYFSQLGANNPSSAQATLREMANDNSSESFYPRSRLLARLNDKSATTSTPAKPSAITPAPVVAEPPPSEPLLAPEAVTIDTLEKFTHQVSSRRSSGFNASPDYATATDLLPEATRLNYAANQLKLGNPVPAFALPRVQNSGARIDAYTSAFARVQQTIIVRALPLQLHPPADLKPVDTETPDAYLQRVVTRAREAKDWQLVFRALELGQTLRLQYGGGLSSNSEMDSYRQFFTAMNQERAGQWTAAARSYLAALKTDSPNIPAEEIGARLKALKEAHPKEYDTAENPTYPVYPGSYPPGVVYPSRVLPNGTMINGVPVMPGMEAPRALPTPLPAPPPDSAIPTTATTAKSSEKSAASPAKP